MKKKIFFLLLLILLIIGVNAISVDEAINFVSTQNNYLLSGEKVSVAKELIQHKNTKYIIVATTNNNIVTSYIPINNSTGEIAKQDIEKRELIKTAIIFTKINELNQSITPSDWPFSYSTKSFFDDLAREFSSTKNDLTMIGVELENLGADKIILTKSIELQKEVEKIIKDSEGVSSEIEKKRVFETTFFNSPDTNKIVSYEKHYNTYFELINKYKNNFNEFESKLNELLGLIAVNEEISIDNKRNLQVKLVSPISTRKLPTFFKKTDELRTTIESVFSSAKNSEGFATTLKSRELRNSAWVELFGKNEALLKINNGFESLEKAADFILSTENINYWENTSVVDSLIANWNAAKNRYNNAEYDKAREYAKRAQKNVEQIISDGFKETQSDANDYILIIAGVLVSALIGLFVYENFYLKKKKKKEDYDEPY